MEGDMALNTSKLAQAMLTAAKGALTKAWPEAQAYAEMEFTKIAQNLAAIEMMKLAGTITEEKARLQFDIQKNASRAVLLTLEGLGIIAVEQAINSALALVKDTVNKAIGWTLL
jgi:hypothetical protein